MASIPNHSSLLRLFVGASVVLTMLVFLSQRLVVYEVAATELIGTYEKAQVPFLRVAHVPDKLTLNGDGSMMLHETGGELVFSGRWMWDEKEAVIRVDDRQWDRQIRLRSTLTGHRLAMRISALSLEEDHPEHDEEVDLIKVPVNRSGMGS